MELTDFPNYLIYPNGDVWSKTTKLFLKPYFTRKKYLEVRLYGDKIKRLMRIHRLVALAYIPNPNNYPQVNHN